MSRTPGPHTWLREWREAVLFRDGYTCQRCKTTIDVCAHHIKPKREYPELKYDVTNGQALCRACHSSIERNRLGTATTEIGRRNIREARLKQPNRGRNLYKFKCAHCGIDTESKGWRVRFCSLACDKASRRSARVPCAMCGKMTTKPNAKFCSRVCFFESQRPTI